MRRPIARDINQRKRAVSTQVSIPLYSDSSGRQNIVIDSYDRADDASSMGNAETGQTWVPNVGTFGISSNQAYTPISTNQGTSVVETGLANCIIEATVSSTGVFFEASLCFRSVDNTNYFIGNASNLFVRTTAGGFTNLGTWSYGNGARLRVELYGPYIRCFVNNVLRLSVTNTNHQTATKHGIRIHLSTTDRVDNFRVTS